MKLGIFEILAAADKEPVRDDKIKVLRENVCQPLIDVLIGAYDDRVKWLLPPGNVPFKPAASSGAESMLHSQTRTFYLYVEGGGNDDLTQLRREVLFIQLLESIDPRDAVLMSHVKDKTLPYPTLTRELIDEAFPKMLYIEGRPADEVTKALEESMPPEVAKALEESTPPKKRGRGRPRKHPKPDPNTPKRSRGRPRKDSPTSVAIPKEE